MPLTTFTYTTFDDCSGTSTLAYIHTGNTSVYVGRHWDANIRPAGGFRFQVPDSINPNDITEVRFKATTASIALTNVLTVKVAARANDTAAFANNGTDAPWPRAEAGKTAYGSVSWSVTNCTVGQRHTSPDILTQVKSALLATTPSGGFRTIGIYLCGDTGANEEHQLAAIENTTYPEATLEITTNVVSIDGSATSSAPSFSLSTGEPNASGWNLIENIGYHDGIGNPTNRVLDIYLPTGNTPPGGWPVALFAHGGAFFGGDENEPLIAQRFIADTIKSGFAIVSPRYKLTDGNLLLNTNTGFVRPAALQDVICSINWIRLQETYPLNEKKIVGMGYSAGGHLILEAALLLEDPNRNNYISVYRGNSVMNVTESRTDIPKLRGVFSFSGAVKLTTIPAVNPIIEPYLNLYWGALPQSSYVYSGVGKEGDLDSMIMGESGSIYVSRGPVKPTFPIAISYTTGDLTVPPSTSYTPLRSALSAVGYDVAQDSNHTVASGVALSRHGYVDTYFGAGGHDGSLLTYSSEFYVGWLEELLHQMQIYDTRSLFYYDGTNEYPASSGYYASGNEEMVETFTW